MKQITLTALLLLAQLGLCHAQLSLAYNRIRPGDRLVKYQVEYKDPGPAGENILWDFSSLKTVNENYTVTYSDPELLGDSLYVLGSRGYPKAGFAQGDQPGAYSVSFNCSGLFPRNYVLRVVANDKVANGVVVKK